MPEHRLQIDYRDGTWIASCSCGGWRREGTIDPVEWTLDVLQHFQQQHEEHVSEVPE